MFGRRKRWDRSQYPENWEELSENCRREANYTCQDCGYVRGTPKISKAGKVWYDPLDASHDVPNDTHNPHPRLTCRCKSCHRIYDNQFADIIEEGQHQARLHEIALEQEGYAAPLKYYKDCSWCWGECQGHRE